MTLTDTQKSVANKLIDDLAKTRNYMAGWSHTKPAREIIKRIDVYFVSLDPLYDVDVDDMILGVEEKTWLARLKDRLYKRGKEALDDGLKLAGWVRGKAILAYEKTKDWVKHNPTKAVLLAYFGVPVAIQQIPNWVSTASYLVSMYTIYKTVELAAKVTADTIKEEVVSPITTLLWIAGAIGVVWLFREELFGG